jgi:hypothetical protein
MMIITANLYKGHHFEPPYDLLSSRELQITGAHRLDNRPSLSEVAETFRSAKIIAYVGASILTFILIILWPSCMLTVDVMNQSQFSQWVSWLRSDLSPLPKNVALLPSIWVGLSCPECFVV